MDIRPSDDSTPLPTPQVAALRLRALFDEDQCLDILRLAACYSGGWTYYLDPVGLWIVNPEEAAEKQRRRLAAATRIFDPGGDVEGFGS